MYTIGTNSRTGDLGPDDWCDAIAELAAPWHGRYGAIGGAVTGVVNGGRCWSALNPATLPVSLGYPLGEALANRGTPRHAA